MSVNTAEQPITGDSVAAGNHPSDTVICAQGLRMSYGKNEVIRGIDLEVRRGEVFAFLGPNGAGKTTTVEILEGYRRPTGGTVSVLGENPSLAGRDWRARIGVVLQESQPEPELRVRECLALYAGYYPHPRPIDETLELVGLAEKQRAMCRALSGGERRRLEVAIGLIGDPELLFLDEPTTGFDPSARRAAWQMIAGLKTLGKTIFLTTHYMEEAERLADRVNIIVAGRIVARGTPGNLGGRDAEEAIISFRLPAGLNVGNLPAAITPLLIGGEAGRLELRTDDPLKPMAALTTWALDRGIDLPDLRLERPTLEDVYLQLTREKVT